MIARRLPAAAHIRLFFGLCLLGLVLCGSLTLGADGVSQNSAKVEWNLVPLDRREVWPPGDWRPLKRSKLDLKKLAQPAADDHKIPQQFPIRRAVYSARLGSGDRLEGTLDLTIDPLQSPGQFITLDPLSVSISELSWDGQEAVWGTTAAGRLLVRPQSDKQRLQGHWSLHGEQHSFGSTFEIQLADAAGSQLNIELPQNYRLLCDQGVVTGPAVTGDSNSHTWTIELGRATRAVLNIEKQPASPAQKTPFPVLIDKTVTLTASAEQFRIQGQLRLDILQESLSKLNILLDADVKLHSIVTEDGAALPLEIENRENQQVVTVTFEEPLQGSDHVLQLHATAPLTMERQIHLPQIQIPAAVVEQGRLNLIIPSPFELKKISPPDGYRQVETSSGGNAVAFQHYGPDRDITAVLGWPLADLSCRVFSHLHSARDNWETRSQMLWRCQQGQKFSLRSSIPAEWDVAAVSLRDPQGEFQAAEDWVLEPGAHGERILVINLRESLTVDKPVVVEVVTLSSSATREGALVIPAPIPLETDNVETLFSVADLSESSPSVEPGSTFLPIAKTRIPEIWKQFSLWNAATQIDRSSLVFLSTVSRPHGQLSIRSDQTPLNIVAEAQIVLSDEQAEESFEISGSAAAASISQLLVYISEPGPEIQWRVEQQEGTPLIARKLAISRHRNLGLPLFGELWEIQLPDSTATTVTLYGRRLRQFSSSGKASLLFVPGTNSFQGTLQVATRGDRQPRFVATNLRERTALEATPAAAEETVHVWTYISADAALQIDSTADSAATMDPVIPSVSLRSLLSSVPQGNDLHWAVIDVAALTEQDQLIWSLPENARVIEVLWDQSPVQPFRDGLTYSLQCAALGPAQTALIHYRTAAAKRAGSDIANIPVPQFNVKVIELNWDVLLPQQSRLHVLSGDARVLSQQIQTSWQERLFGPLAQTSGSAAEKREDLVQTETPIFSELAAQLPAPPQGWRLHRVSYSQTPTFITIAVWDAAQRRYISVALMLGCLIAAACLRAAGVPFRSRFVIVWLILCGVTAIWIPIAYAEIAGGVFVGSLLACLLPLVEKLLIRSKTAAEDPKSLGSTRRFLPIGTASLIGFLCLQQALAQETVAPVLGDDITTRHRVLLPYEKDDPRGRRSEWVYVEPHTLAALKEPTEPAAETPAYLIRSARYDLQVTPQLSNQCRIQYTVYVLSTKSDVTVRLPLDRLVLMAENACRVNGESAPLSRDPADGSLLIDVPGAKTDAATADPPVVRYDIELAGTVAATQTPQRVETSLNLPQVAGSEFFIQLSNPELYARLATDQNLSVELSPAEKKGDAAIPLARAETVELTWSEEPYSDLPRVNYSTACLAQVTPSLIRYQARATYRFEDRHSSHLIWNLPANVIPLSVKGTAVAGFRLIPTSEQERKVAVELASPPTQEIDLLAEFLAPVPAIGDGISVPVLDLSPQNATVVPANESFNLFAVSTPPEYDAQIAPLNVELATPLEKTAFLEKWQGDSSQPRVAYSLSGSTNFVVSLKPLTLIRSVSTEFQGRISRSQLDWQLTAKMNVRSALAFQHRLQIDPRLRIESISVKQDDAERLRRWTRTDDQLALFLKTGAVGDQIIRLSGTMPLKFPDEFNLPAIGFFDADLTSAELLLWQANDISANLLGIQPDGTSLFPEDFAAVTNNDLPMGRFRVPLGRDMGQFSVATEKNSPRIVMDAFHVLDMRVNSQERTSYLKFDVQEGHASEFVIKLPAALAQTCQIDYPENVRKESRDDGVEFTFLPSGPRQRELVARLTFPIEPDDEGRLALEEIVSVNAVEGDRFLQLLGDDESFAPADEFSGLIEEPLPAKFEKWATHDPPAPFSRVFRGEPGVWQFRSYDDPSEQTQSIGLVDHRLRLDSARNIQGTTTLLILPCEQERLTVAIPLGTQLQSVLTERGRRVNSHVENGVASITLDNARVGERITLLWNRPATATNFIARLFGNLQCPLPQPQNFSSKETTALVIPPAHTNMSVKGGESHRSAIAHELNRLEADYALCRAQTAAGHPQISSLWRSLQTEQRRLANSLANSTDPDAANLKSRIDQLGGQIALQIDQRETLPGSDALGTERAAQFANSNMGDQPEGSVSVSLNKTAMTANLGVVTYDQRLGQLGITVLVLLLIIGLRKLVRRYWQFNPAAWMIDHPRVAWICVGLLWWQFLTPAWLGWVVILVSLASWLYEWKAEPANPSEVDFVVNA